MQTLRWLLFLPLYISCTCAFIFSPLWEKAKESPGKVPCGRHFRVGQNLPEHSQSWLGSKWLWLFFVIMVYVVLTFRGDSEEAKVKGCRGHATAVGLRNAGCPLGTPRRFCFLGDDSSHYILHPQRMGQFEMAHYTAHRFSVKFCLLSQIESRYESSWCMSRQPCLQTHRLTDTPPACFVHITFEA